MIYTGNQYNILKGLFVVFRAIDQILNADCILDNNLSVPQRNIYQEWWEKKIQSICEFRHKLFQNIIITLCKSSFIKTEYWTELFLNAIIVAVK